MGCEQSTEMAFSNRGSAKILDRKTLESYLETERAIEKFHRENADTVAQLEVKSAALSKLEHKLTQLEQNDSSESNSKEEEKEETLMANTKATLRRMSTMDTLTNKEEDQMATLNQLEIRMKEKEETTRQKESVAEEVEQLQAKAEELQQLYAKQDQLLARIFGGEYGSALERQLEQQLDSLQEQKARIMEANFKWRQAQMMMEYACKQLAVAVQKWHDLPNIPVLDLEIRYTTAEETRDNLVAASQNMQTAQQYLDNVDVPYCTPDEVQTLNKATNYVFTDMQSDERHEYAQSCYTISHQRASALLQWMDKVLKTTIAHDLEEVNKKVKETSSALRQERVSLIKQKVREIWGTDIEVEVDPPIIDENQMEETIQIAVSDAEVVKTNISDDDHEMLAKKAEIDEDQESLAPLPSDETLFGQSYANLQNELNEMKSQHECEMSQFMQEKQRQATKSRLNLAAKLDARRKVRALKNQEHRQKQDLETITSSE